MKTTIYIVSYSSFFEEICNNVIPFTNINDAIDSANAYIDEVNDNMPFDAVVEKNFNDYKNGYKEINITNIHNGYTYLISITENKIAI